MSQLTEPIQESAAREKYCVLIPHPTEIRALVVPRGDGWALPEFVPEREIYDEDLLCARRTMRAQLQIDAPLRYALRLFETAIPGPLNVFAMQAMPGDWHPPAAGRWIGHDALSDLEMSFPRQRQVLQAWFDDAMGAPLPALALPWWRPGWLTEVEDWLLPRMQRLGYTATGSLEGLKSSYTSGVVQVPATPADLYLKVMARPLAHEARLLPILAEQDASHFPTVLVADTQEGWVLMRNMGGRPLGSDVPVWRWEEIARAYGQLQVASVPLVDRWLAMGCLDLRLTRFEEEMDFLFAHVPERMQGLNEQLSRPILVDSAALQARAAEFKRIASELAGYGLPWSLEHGDFHAGNVRVTEDGCIFYDWSHACVTFPLSGLGDLLYDDDWFPDQPDFSDRVRDAYLQPWTAYAPMHRLQAAFNLSQRLRTLLAAIHQGRLIAAFQQMLGGQDYIPETPTGNAFHHLQWWLGQKFQTLAQMDLS
jgi:Phosphotransferase enzyme family